MVRQYAKRFYVTAIRLSHKLTHGELAAAKSLTAWKDRVRDAWPGVAVKEVRLESRDEVAVREPLPGSANLQPGPPPPGPRAPQLSHGPPPGGPHSAPPPPLPIRPIAP